MRRIPSAFARLTIRLGLVGAAFLASQSGCGRPTDPLEPALEPPIADERLPFVQIQPANPRMGVGDTLRLWVVRTSVRLRNRTTWATSQPALATVDSFGLVTARAVGPVAVRATVSGWGEQASGAVTVRVE